MMFTWLHLTTSVTFLEVLCLVCVTVSAVKLGYSDSVNEENVSNNNRSALDAALDASTNSNNPMLKAEIKIMSPFSEKDKLSLEDVDENSGGINLPNFKYQKNHTTKINETYINLIKDNKSNSSDEKCITCQQNNLAHLVQQNNLSSPIHVVDLINHKNNNLEPHNVDIHSLSPEIQPQQTNLKQRDLSGSYDLDNFNENYKDSIATTTTINNFNGNLSYTNSDMMNDKTMKITGIISHPQNQDLELSKSHETSSPISVILDQDDHNFSSVSNNRTVGLYSSDISTNVTSSYEHDNVSGRSTINVNKHIDSDTTSGEKLSKSSSTNLKNQLKSYKNKTSPEIKTVTKNTSNSAVKYFEEAKKKALTKALNDGIVENASLQQGDVIHNGDPVSLMSDEPEDSSGQQKSRGAILVPEEDSSEFSQHDNGTANTGVINATVLETNETFSTAAHGHTMKPLESTSRFDIAVISGIAVGILIISSLIGAVSFVVYRHRYWNKPQTLSDKCSNADSSGYIDDSTLRDNSEEMYSLDNDSFLNSLEAMTIQNYWTDNVKHTKL